MRLHGAELQQKQIGVVLLTELIIHAKRFLYLLLGLALISQQVSDFGTSLGWVCF